MIHSPTTFVYGVASLLGFCVAYIGVDLTQHPPSSKLPPAIKINEMVIRDDGTTVYDREILTEKVWQAWAGQIFLADGKTLHCSGGDLAKYEGPLYDPAGHDVNWLVGDDCMTGLEAGMLYSFTWTPIGPDYAPVRYPETGFGVVIEAD